MRLCWRGLGLFVLSSSALVFAAVERGEAEIFDIGVSSVVLSGGTSSGASTNVTNSNASSAGANAVNVRFGINVNADDSEGAGDTRQDPGRGRFTLSFAVRSSGNYDLQVAAFIAGSSQTTADAGGCEAEVSPLPIAGPLLLRDGVTPLSLPSLSFNEPAFSPLVLAGGTRTVDFSNLAPKAEQFSRHNAPPIESYEIIVVLGAKVVSDSCEASFRMGAQNGSTEGCNSCGYPGTPTRTLEQDGYFLSVLLIDKCGDGLADPGEQCDLGAQNGAPSSCCTSACRFRQEGGSCRAAAGVCDQAEFCSGSDFLCPADVKSTGSVCRPAVGVCDAPEVCSGSGNNCPPDEFQPSTFVCRPAVAECDGVESCTGSSSTCPNDMLAPLGTPCTSDGNSCTTDFCEESGTCSHLNNNNLCDDGVNCTSGDRCISDTCQGTPLECPGGSSCVEEAGGACLANGPDLEMTNTSSGGAFFPGDTVDYTITIRNKGQATATAVQFEDVFPPGTTFLSVEGPIPGLDIDPGSQPTIRWTGDIAPNAAVVVVIRVRIVEQASCFAPIENLAVIRSPTLLTAGNVVSVLCQPPPPDVCAGDCNADDEVAPGEIATAVNIALGRQELSSCQPADANGSRGVAIDDLLRGADHAIHGCPFSYPRLAGSWLGPLVANGMAFTQVLTITPSGTLEGPGPLSAPLTPLDRANRIYGFHRSDDLTGALQFSLDGRHAVYIDEFFAFGAVEKGATRLAPAYGNADLGMDNWSGTVSRYGPADRMPGAHTELSVDAAAEFVGTIAPDGSFAQVSGDYSIGTKLVPLTIASATGFASIGGFGGDWESHTGEPRTGEALFLMSPDKSFLSALACSDTSLPQCEVSAWSRPEGSYASTCVSCTLLTPPAKLRCDCKRDDRQSIGTSEIPLPCDGSIENLDGTLTCQRAVGEIIVANGEAITVFPLRASGATASLRRIAGPATGLTTDLRMAVDPSHQEIFASRGSAIAVFALGADGDTAPLRTIAGPSTGMITPTAIAVDAVHDEIYVVDGTANTIAVYARAASGDVPPLRTIAGASTLLNSPEGVAVDPARDEIFVAHAASAISVYGRTASGDVPPLRSISGVSTGLIGPRGLTLDSSRGEILVANADDSTITAYPIAAAGDVAPLRRLSGPSTTLLAPTAVALDAATDRIFVTNLGSFSVKVFSRSATGDVAPLRSIPGLDTLLSAPFGIAVVQRGSAAP